MVEIFLSGHKMVHKMVDGLDRSVQIFQDNNAALYLSRKDSKKMF